MKRILIYSLAYFPKFVGGAEVAIKEITDRISPTDCVFDLITLHIDKSDPPYEVIGNVHVYRVGSGTLLGKVLSPLTGLIKTFSLLRTHTYDWFWVMMVTYIGGSAYIANILRFWNRVPIILTLQEGDSEKYIRTKWGGLVALSWYLALFFTQRVQVISTYLEKRARDFGYTGEIILVPNGATIQHFAQTFPKEVLDDCKDMLNKKADEVCLVTTSRLVEKNALDIVIRSLPLLPDHISFVIFGTGSDEEMLRGLAESLGVSDRVKLMGQLSHADMPKYLKACDIFVRPSRSEGFGNSFIEAMAAGLPVIATQEGGIADFLFDAKRNPDKATTGWAVDTDSPEQVAKAVQDILSDKDRTARVVAEAKNMATEMYDWGPIAKAMRERVFARAT